MNDFTNHTDVNQLLKLIGTLGDPAEPGFWDTWRIGSDGYAFGKMKGEIAAATREAAHPIDVQSFAGYILKFFTTDSPQQEKDLIKEVSGPLSPHAEEQLAIEFLADIRRTAWRVYRDYSDTDPQTVGTMWANAKR